MQRKFYDELWDIEICAKNCAFAHFFVVPATVSVYNCSVHVHLFGMGGERYERKLQKIMEASDR